MKYSLPFALLLLLACKNNSPQSPLSSEEQASAQEQPMPEGFAEFYQEFHSDSLFQVEHIVFPLEGLPDDADSLTIAEGRFRWQPEDWKMQRSVDYEMSDFIRQINPVNENMVVERIVHKSGEVGMVRRFAKVAGEWHLIYYAGMNRLAK